MEFDEQREQINDEVLSDTISEEILPEKNNTNYPMSLFKYLEKVKVTDGEILQYHQKVVKHYFTTNPNHRGLLVFHGTGTGKTMLSVSIADVMKDDRRVVILSAKSLQHNFKKEVEKYMSLLKKDAVDIEETIEKKYKFVSSNAGNMLSQMSSMGKTTEELEFEKTLEVFTNKIDLEGTLLIIDEAQNFFNGIVNGSKNATGLYRTIIDATDIKLIFLSATPIINDPFEIVPMFNMLHGSILLPEDYDDFYNFYIDTDKLMVKNKEKFKNRIFGMVSYMGDWWKSGGLMKPDQIIKRDLFPDQLPTIIEYIPMSTQQFAGYSSARDLESEVKAKKTVTKENLQKPKSNPGSTYRVASRQISNFLLPEIAKVKKLNEYGFTKNIDKLTKEHMTNLDIYSPKMKKILENVRKHSGLSVVYSSFVTGEGLRIFSEVLIANGWRMYDPKKPKRSSEKIFVFITGQVSAEERAYVISEFNRRENRDGEEIDMMLLSGAGAEGLDLKNVRSIHIMEPYWNYGRIEQIIARAVRYRSHDHFDNPEDKTVQPYIYLSDYPTNFVFIPTKTKKVPEKTTDVHLYTKSIKNKLLIDRVYAAIIETSIDCSVHIKTAPVDVQKKIDCLMCTPTNNKMFHPSIDIDMKMKNPCTRPKTTSITAEEIVYQDKTYYYTKSEGSISIYEYKKTLDAYIELDRSHPHYDVLIEKLASI
jgi:superfamily II DNA or RNA helicase